jgi:predicted N-acyltransferase
LCVSDYLKSKRDADTIWISEPEHEAAWNRSQGYDSFRILPMVQVDVSNLNSFEQYLRSLTKKRRKNLRHDQQTFSRRGGTIEILKSPIEADDIRQMYRLLLASSRRGWLTVPYGDVLDNETAFATQSQTALVAKVGGAIVSFVSYVSDGPTLLQCHGGMDYQVSLEVKAYHNLLSASIEFAIDRGFERVSFGPLNNETKRRAGTSLLPMVAGLWSRSRFQGFFTRTFIIPNMQVYSGSCGDSGFAG